MLSTSQVFTLLRTNADIARAYGTVQSVELETSTHSARYWIAQTKSGYVLELTTNEQDQMVDLKPQHIKSFA